MNDWRIISVLLLAYAILICHLKPQRRLFMARKYGNKPWDIWVKAALHEHKQYDCSQCQEGKMLNGVHCWHCMQACCGESLIAKVKHVRLSTGKRLHLTSKAQQPVVSFNGNNELFCQHSQDWTMENCLIWQPAHSPAIPEIISLLWSEKRGEKTVFSSRKWHELTTHQICLRLQRKSFVTFHLTLLLLL